MATLRVLRPFYDKAERVDRRPGETFSASAQRAEVILAGLPGYAELVKEDLAAMTLSELKELAKERGVKVPAKATKANIVELLEG